MEKKLERLLKIEAKWKRRQTIAQNKYAAAQKAVRREIMAILERGTNPKASTIKHTIRKFRLED